MLQRKKTMVKVGWRPAEARLGANGLPTGVMLPSGRGKEPLQPQQNRQDPAPARGAFISAGKRSASPILANAPSSRLSTRSSAPLSVSVTREGVQDAKQRLEALTASGGQGLFCPPLPDPQRTKRGSHDNSKGFLYYMVSPIGSRARTQGAGARHVACLRSTCQCSTALAACMRAARPWHSPHALHANALIPARSTRWRAARRGMPWRTGLVGACRG